MTNTAFTTNDETPNHAASDTGPTGATHAPPEKTTYYEQLGGAAGIRHLVNTFYDEMECAPDAAALRAMHATDLTPMRETLFEF